MTEQTDKPPANPEKDAVASDPAAVTAPEKDKGTKLTDEQVQTYLTSHPDAWQNLKAPVKVDGKEMEVPLAAVRDGFQLRSASQARFEEAAAKEKDLAAREAKLAEQGDPVKQLLERLKPAPKPPETPLEGLDFANDPFTATPQLANVTRELYKQNQAQEAKLKEYEKQSSEVKALAEGARDAQRNYEIRVKTETDFEKANQHNPNFTARLVVRDGKYDYDYGKNKVVSMTTIALANSEVPDAILGGKVGNTMSLGEITDCVIADLDRQDAERRAATAAEKKARLKNLASVAPTGAVMPEAPSKTTILPTDDAKTIGEKTALIEREIREQMAADGFKG